MKCEWCYGAGEYFQCVCGILHEEVWIVGEEFKCRQQPDCGIVRCTNCEYHDTDEEMVGC